MEELLKCAKCGRHKPTSEFQRRSRNKRGYAYWCKDCYNARRRLRRQRRPRKTPKTSEKPQFFVINSMRFCEKLREPHKTIAMRQIHMLAKKQAIIKVNKFGYVEYLFLDKTAYEDFLNEAERIKTTYQESH